MNSCFCYFLGLWKGYFIDNRALRGKSAGSKWLIDVNMTFQSRDQFTARGSDEIGSFTFKNGKITGTCKKQYNKASQLPELLPVMIYIISYLTHTHIVSVREMFGGA